MEKDFYVVENVDIGGFLLNIEGKIVKLDIEEEKKKGNAKNVKKYFMFFLIK